RARRAEDVPARNLQVAAVFLAEPKHQSFERPYGWAWVLKLAEELHGWDDADGREWSKNLQPLTDTVVARYLAHFPKQPSPIRNGLHTNTAFGLAFAHDYARAVGHKPLQEMVEERSRAYYAADGETSAAREPGRADFLSPSLVEADLMRRVLPPAEFPIWLTRFLPDLAKGEPKTLFEPVQVSDR